MRYADRGKDRRQFLYVLDSDLRRTCAERGLKLIQTLKDINGRTIYVFDMNRLSFDISDEISAGRCYVSNRCTLSF